MTRQQARVRRAVRLMATGTTLQPYRRMLKGKRTPFIAMAFKAARLVSKRSAHRLGLKTTMRIVTVDAGHRAFGKTVFIRTLKRSPHRQMAGCALLIDGCRPADQQGFAARSVDRMTGTATDLVFGVAAEQPARVRFLVQMAGKTTGIELVRGLLAGIVDIGSGGRFRMLGSRSVAGFTGVPFPAAMLIALQCAVSCLEQGDEDFFVASLTRFRPGVFRASGRSRCRRGGGPE
jgi:hypothetical protein